MILGYARVSTDGQSVETQVRQLRAAGAGKVFREVASGAKTDRAQLRRLLDQLAAGDVVMVTRLDRLARSTRDLLNTLETITGKQACQSAPKRDPESAPNRDPHRRLSSGRPRSPWRGPARVAQCPHKRRSGARGEALWTPGGDPRA